MYFVKLDDLNTGLPYLTQHMVGISAVAGAQTYAACMKGSSMYHDNSALRTTLVIQLSGINTNLSISRQVNETDDDVLRKEMASLLEPITLSGQHVLLAAQKLSIQPSLTAHKEELIAAAQTVFLGVVKVRRELEVSK